MRKVDRVGEDKGKVKFRFIEFELEGFNSTIEQSIKSIISSMNRGPGLSAVNTPKLPNPAELGADGDDPIDNGEQEPILADGDTVAPQPRPKGQTRYQQPKFLDDLDLDSGEVPFKSYSETINPQKDNHRYLVIANWLKQYRGLDSITIHHVYTCYQKMHWRSQKDVAQPFRVMKRRKDYFTNPERGQWAITHIGIDAVNESDEASE